MPSPLPQRVPRRWRMRRRKPSKPRLRCACSPPLGPPKSADMGKPRGSRAPAVGPWWPPPAVKWIGNAGQKPPRCAGLTLLIAGEGAVAETRKFVALQAERIAATHGLGGREPRRRQSAGGQQSQEDAAHRYLPPAEAGFLD